MLVTTLVVSGSAVAGASLAPPPILVSSREGNEVVFRLVTAESNQIIAREANPDDRGVRFVFAVSSDGKRFLRIRPSPDGKVATIIASGIDGKVIGEYIFEVGDPAAWWYGWDGERAFALHSLPSGKWKYWVPGSKVAEVSEAQLPANFRNAIARSPNKEFHTSHPEAADWTIGYLSDAPESIIPDSPYTFVGGSGIGTYSDSSATFFYQGEVIAFRRPRNLLAWWNLRFVDKNTFCGIGIEVDPTDRYIPRTRPFLDTVAFRLDAKTGVATTICPAVYAIPLPAKQ